MVNHNDTILCRDSREIAEVFLGSEDFTIEEFVAVARYGAKVRFSSEYCERVKKTKGLLEKFLKENRLIYGVTTGFGDNVRNVISPEDSEKLQTNIIRSHACAVGEPLEKEVVRAIQLMMLLNMGLGYSGASLGMLELLRDQLNNEVTPFAPGEGSVGYLGVEGHIALVLIGEGKAWYKGELLEGGEALSKAGLKPVKIQCKEGLSLLNGSTSVTAIAVLAIYNAIQATKVGDIAGALAYEALQGTLKACDKRIIDRKKHIEQSRTAENLLAILKDSEISKACINLKVQDCLALRQIPQMHGAVKRTLREAMVSIAEEMNSSSDNPIIFPQDDDGIALSGGNFDGSYVGIHADSACIAMGVLAKLSERKIDRLVNWHLSGYPSFLVKNPGLNNGYMIPQYTAAGLVGEIKVLSHPSSVDNISTSASQEDPVSLAYFASKKAYQVSKKLEYILAIEIMTEIQALDFIEDMKPSTVTKAVYDLVREKVPPVDQDRHFYPDIEYIKDLIHDGTLVKCVEDRIGSLKF
ncbi:HAL/PAL/TAL family ammonia-lyase [Clostridium peptidivorans]|uniref:HAL/PAL/TAL family ammonia-lyase n=1 Tax=Clostridium peptidivorans TaxID=100174 RepID=UPI000BE33A37|nr:aromatic amino acid ammonia-lyase [Clostridium peptidivorans]